jgi:hypothetical protein
MAVNGRRARFRKDGSMGKRLLAGLAILATWIGLSSTGVGAQQGPASADQLAAITRRGRALEAYDQAAWHGSDAAKSVVATDTTGLELYVARKTPTGWAVDFGKLDPAGTTFLTSVEAQSTDGLNFTAQRLNPPRRDSGFLVGAAHAIKTAEVLFKPVSGFRYNVAVLPSDGAALYVYLYPAQTDPRIFPIGGDERFTVSADGMTILEAHRMHNSVLAQPENAGVPADSKPVAGVRSVVVANVPQDTDVFHVLARKPAMPDYVVAQGQVYRINVDGSIDYVGSGPKRP